MREHAQALDLFLRARLRDPGDVDDVFQEALIVAWRRLADYDPERRFGPWIRGIARRIALHRAHAAGARPERARLAVTRPLATTAMAPDVPSASQTM